VKGGLRVQIMLDLEVVNILSFNDRRVKRVSVEFWLSE
jgi:hypothetical protein